MKPRFAARQRGVAVVTALLLTTLAVTIVASLFWQQQVQVRSIENQRLHSQTRWIVRSGLDLARLILRQDMLDSRTMTRADGLWATPLAETRLDDFVKREKIEGETFDATISGQNYDAQSRYNLVNLASTTGAGGINKKQMAVFARLLQILQLDPALAKAVATQVARSEGAGLLQPPPGTPPTPDIEPVLPGSGQPMKMLRAEDLLSVSGFDQKAIDKLRDFVVVLPAATPVNVNTAPAEVLAALINGSLSEGQNLVVARKRAPFLNVGNFKQNAGKPPLLQDSDMDCRSDYFLVMSRVKLDRAELVSWSLIHRDQNGTQVVWIREI
ncbi:type II secretion system protein K (GspK) [Duganella sp. CF458]|uniref:type II secretion system minor pseudopilin GspK n=1 Tax=Duganella sp. CF458 TaxID=1884368 RepID=UPI0008E12CC9|nr:type II secretion system minor pseudopilin GspK [Duganella sp. CF458]SFF69017.1 type II secretion system protein K (GspK) [Duganella sp. CF458]